MLVFVDASKLKQHESIDQEYVERLAEKIWRDGFLRLAIAVDIKTGVVLDGHHRLSALLKLGCKRIPVVYVDYDDPAIKVLPWREGERIDKEMVRSAGLSEVKMPAKTSKHVVDKDDVRRHLECLEIACNASLNELGCEAASPRSTVFKKRKRRSMTHG